MSIDCQAASVNAEGLTPLDIPPAKILDIYSSVLGDGWHLMDRPKIKKGHVARSPFKVEIQEGLYAWNPTRMEHMERTLMLNRYILLTIYSVHKTTVSHDKFSYLRRLT
jgi:hypothetical protein